MLRRFALPMLSTLFPLVGMLTYISTATAASESENRAEVQIEGIASSTMGLEGSYQVFSSFRDALVEKIRAAKSRVYFVTLSFTDGDLATALLSARLRGSEVKVIIDPKRTRNYASRHAYFVENQIVVMMRPLTKEVLGAGTVLLIDDKTIAVDSTLDARTKGGVSVIPGPPWEEVEGWFQKLPIKPWRKAGYPKPLASMPKTQTKPAPTPAPMPSPIPAPNLAPAVGAKNPTMPPPPYGQPATIKTTQRENVRVPTRRGLPVRTRARQIETGEIAPESLGQKQGKGTGSLSPVPGDSKREESLTGLN